MSEALTAKAILRILLRNEELATDVDLDRLAKDTDGFSGSDLKRKSSM
jgi:ATP-dependent Zn protease